MFKISLFSMMRLVLFHVSKREDVYLIMVQEPSEVKYRRAPVIHTSGPKLFAYIALGECYVS